MGKEPARGYQAGLHGSAAGGSAAKAVNGWSSAKPSETLPLFNKEYMQWH